MYRPGIQSNSSALAAGIESLGESFKDSRERHRQRQLLQQLLQESGLSTPQAGTGKVADPFQAAAQWKSGVSDKVNGAIDKVGKMQTVAKVAKFAGSM